MPPAPQRSATTRVLTGQLIAIIIQPNKGYIAVEIKPEGSIANEHISIEPTTFIRLDRLAHADIPDLVGWVMGKKDQVYTTITATIDIEVGGRVTVADFKRDAAHSPPKAQAA